MKNMKVYALAGVAVLAAVGGTFAYYNATQTFENPFNTSNYGTYAVEQFNPADGNKWEPGVEVEKKVFATNTGEGDVWVRIKLDEAWTNLKSDADTKVWGYTQLKDTNPDNAANAKQENAEDGMVEADRGSVVYKAFTESITEVAGEVTGKDWYYKDGYFYYTKTLATGQVTPDLLNSVTLCGDTDMGNFEDKTFYKLIPTGTEVRNSDGTINEELKPYDDNGDLKEGWTQLDIGEKIVAETDANGNTVVKIKNADETDKETINVPDGQTVYTYKDDQLKNNEHGYANANYALNITVEFVQANPEAAEAGTTENGGKWGWNPSLIQATSEGSNQQQPQA